MKNKIMWKDVTLIVLAILLIFSMCRIHTLKQSNKKLYSQNLELNHQLATLKEKNAGLESKLNSEESITDEKKSDDSYSFNYKHMWEIKYVEDNEFVSFYDADAGYYVASALGGSDIENDGTFTYDFSDNDFRIYLDYETPSGELTIINYSVDDDEFTLMIDGERRNPTKEFDQKLRENGLIEDIFNDDLDKFEQNLQENGLSLGDVSSVSYDDVKSKSQ